MNESLQYFLEQHFCDHDTFDLNQLHRVFKYLTQECNIDIFGKDESIGEGKLNEEAKGYKQALQKFIKYGNKQIKAYFKKNLDKTYERGQYRQLAVLKPGKKYDS